MSTTELGAELRERADWLKTTTDQIAHTGRTENLDAKDVALTLAAMHKAADILAPKPSP